MSTFTPSPSDDHRAFVRTTLDIGGVVLLPWSRETAASATMLKDLIAAAADPLIAVWNPLRTVDRSRALEWLESREEGWDCGIQASFAALSTADDVLLGNVTLRWVDLTDGLATISYWTLPTARGRGVATRATTAVTNWAFHTSRARRIELAHAVGNEASCRVALRCGYLPEGTLRAARCLGDGVYHDGHLHARLEGDPAPTVEPMT